MNIEFQEQYNELISVVQKENRGIKRLKDHGKCFNLHHIIPKILGGNNSNDNIVKLTHEEHFEAHRLLYYMYKGTESRTEYGLAKAWEFMKTREGFSAADYSDAKKSMHNIGASDETKKKMSMSSMGKNNPNCGRKMSDEQRKKISDTKRRKSISDENWELLLIDFSKITNPIIGKTYKELSIKYNITMNFFYKRYTKYRKEQHGCSYS